MLTCLLKDYEYELYTYFDVCLPGLLLMDLNINGM